MKFLSLMILLTLSFNLFAMNLTLEAVCEGKMVDDGETYTYTVMSFVDDKNWCKPDSVSGPDAVINVFEDDSKVPLVFTGKISVKISNSILKRSFTSIDELGEGDVDTTSLTYELQSEPSKGKAVLVYDGGEKIKLECSFLNSQKECLED